MEEPSILFIDDKQLVLQTVRHLFAQSGFDLITADNSFSGLCALLEHGPAKVFIDANTARLDGFQFCLLLKNHPTYRHVPVVIVLEDYSCVEEAKARAVGAEALLVKPFGRKELQALLPQAFKQVS